MWPISPANPLAPTTTRPALISPPPIPVPRVTTTASSAPRAAPLRCSATAAQLASFSTSSSDRGRRAATSARMSAPAAPRRLGEKCRTPWRSSIPGTPTPTGDAGSAPAPAWRPRTATTSATASATSATAPAAVPDGSPALAGVPTLASPTTASVVVHGDAEHLGPADVDAEGDGGPASHAHAEDSTRAFRSRSAVAMIRLCARILMNPGIGTRSSTSRW